MTCRHKCQSKINQNDGQTLFHRYWQLGCVNKQREYLNGLVVECKKKVTKVGETSRRKRSFQWCFKTAAGTFQVCKFLDTLNMTDIVVLTAKLKKVSLGHVKVT